MKLPDMPREGMAVKKWMRDAVLWMRANQVASITGGTLRRTPSGTTLQFKPGESKVSTSTATAKPLTLYQADTDKVGVVDGTVNGQRPTLGGTALDNDPPPTATISATKYFWIKAVCVFSTETYTLTIEQTATTAPPGSPSISSTGFTSYFYIGYAEWDSGAIAAIVNEYAGGNLGVDSFGAYNRWWRL